VMSINYSALETAPRLLIEVPLKPLQGDRFQPTGFPDLGAARYTLHDGTEMLLVESAQSVANRMELACWDEAKDDLIPELQGLPYILVKRPDGSNLTNSVLEAHRINSEYVMSSSFKETFTHEIEYKEKSPINWKKFHTHLLKYDPNCLIHGTFLEEIGGRLRVTRALSGFVEANNVFVAESGGVKNNRVQPGLKGGEGNVPFHRTEFTAEKITAYFSLDLSLLRAYGLGEDATQLLIALSLFKIRRFLSTGLRLRTACDLTMADGIQVTKPANFDLPAEADLLAECKAKIQSCKPLFADPAVTEVIWEPSKKKSKEKEEEEEEGTENNAEDK